MKIECRPYKVHRIAALVIGGLCSVVAVGCLIGSLFYDTPKNLNGWLSIFFIFVSYGSIGIWGLCYFFRAQIVADVEGLRWRTTFSRWKFSKWDEVSDFYALKVRQNGGWIVETPQGILRIGSDYTLTQNDKISSDLDALLRIILEKCANVKAQKSEIYDAQPLAE